MAIIAQDSFTEASTINLSSHTANVGGTWTAALAGGVVNVIGGSNIIEDGNTSNGNRYNLTTSVGAGPIEVTVTFVVTSVSANVFPGIGVRRSTASSANGYEFRYDFINNQWILGDATNTSTFAETWDGTSRIFKVHAEDNLVIGYVNGVEKCRLTTNVNSGNTFAGIIMGNFSGTGGATIQGSSFEVDSAASLINKVDNIVSAPTGNKMIISNNLLNPLVIS